MSSRLENAGDTDATAVYDATLTDVADILDAARSAAARSVNSIITAAYGWWAAASWSTNRAAQSGPNTARS